MVGYDIKLRLMYMDPITWRDIIVPGGISFHQMHKIIQVVFDFYDYHLYSFELPDDNLHVIDKKRTDFLDYGDVNSHDLIIDKFFNKYKKIDYTYDFGDDWEIRIEIKKVLEDYNETHPTFKRLKGEYNPIEDCGGIYELMELVEMFEAGEINEDDEFLLGDLKKVDPEYLKERIEEMNFEIKEVPEDIPSPESYDEFDINWYLREKNEKYAVILKGLKLISRYKMRQ